MLTVPVLDERLHVSKVAVDQGGWRLTRRVDTRVETVDEPLQQQQVEIERRAIGRQVSEIPPTRQEGDTLIVPVVEEVLVLEKRWLLVEEVRIRQVTQTTRHREDVSLRREEIDIERLEPEPASDDQPL